MRDPGPDRERNLFLLGPGVTVVTIIVGHILWRIVFPDHTLIPGAAFAPVFLAVVLSTFLGRRPSGFVSATLATVYVVYFVAIAPELANFARAVLITATLYGAVFLVGNLKQRADASLERQRIIAHQERKDAAEAKRANEILRANNETLETFVYVITHDLKEPVRAIEHHIRQAQIHAGTKETEADIAQAFETNRRLGVLLQRLLEYSRASLTAPTLQPTSLHEVLDDAVCRPIYEHTLLIRKARLNVPREAPTFLADPTLLGQAMGNLILNAVKHNRSDEPQVTIVVTPGENRDLVDIRIQDNGPGFPSALLQRFRSLKTNRPATLSGGFGLVIARRAIERLGGTMTITNLAMGSEVRLTLSRAGAPQESARPEDTIRLAIQTPGPGPVAAGEIPVER